MPRTTNTITLSLPPEMTKKIKKLMREEQRTRAELLREALRYYIEEKEWKKIYKYGESQTKKLGIKKENVERIIDEVRKERKKQSSFGY
jgi:metal-responsive CopG/Arc/MetJ family transcriptional regulator